MSKKNQSKIPAKTKEVQVIPQDLKDKWGSITAIATACACMDKGYYPHNYAQTVRTSIAYLAKLHETLVDDALKHPQSHMISELKEIKKNMAEEAKRAKKNETTDRASTAISSVDPTAEAENAPVHPTPSPSGGREAHP